MNTYQQQIGLGGGFDPSMTSHYLHRNGPKGAIFLKATGSWLEFSIRVSPAKK